MKDPDPHWDDENASTDGWWEHPEHGLWVLYKVDSGDGERYYEFRENNNQRHKPSDHLRERAADKYYERVELLKKNRKVFRSAKGGVGDIDSYWGL